MTHEKLTAQYIVLQIYNGTFGYSCIWLTCKAVHASLYTLFCFSQTEILTAPWIHLNFPVLCHSNSHLHLLKCSSVPEGLVPKVFNDISQNNIISNLLIQLICNVQHTYFWFTSQLILISYFILLDSLAPWEQNLFFFVFNPLPHLLA